MRKNLKIYLKKRIKRVLTANLLILSLFSLFSQTPDYIGGLVLYNPESNDNSPFIQQGKQLILKFDDLRNIYTRYQYTIEHCDYNWEKSSAFPTDYLQGFQSDYIREWSNSFNTIQPYKHYELRFPNDKIQLKISGNYKLKIYTTNPNQPIITKRFSVYNNQVAINSEVLAGRQSLSTQQQLKVDIAFDPSNTDLIRNLKNTHLTIIKNNNWNDALPNLYPTFTNNNKLSYNNLQINFNAGNEYRWLDTKKREVGGFSTLQVEKDPDTKYYTHYLRLDYDRSNEGYQNNLDYNGNFYIRTVDLQAENDIDTQAEYVYVVFALDSPKPRSTNVYVVGGFNDWQMTDKYKMSYDAENKLYSLKLLLKQGTYNYQYALEKNTTKADYSLEGNYWQTTNTYQNLLYFRPWGQRYDLLIGYINSEASF